MPPDLIRYLLQQQPFQPFRLHVLETTAYEIKHPELALLGKGTVTLLFQSPRPFPFLSDYWITIARLHVTRLESIVRPIPATGNGQAGQGAPA